MALTLTLREGHDFYVEHKRFLIVDVLTPMVFAVEDDHGLRHSVNSEDWVSIGAGVSLCSGIPRKQEGRVVRLMVEAPGQRVLRGDLYREKMKASMPTPSPLGKNEPQGLPGACSTCHGTGLLRQQVWRDGKQVQDTFPCPDCEEK